MAPRVYSQIQNVINLILFSHVFSFVERSHRGVEHKFKWEASRYLTKSESFLQMQYGR